MTNDKVATARENCHEALAEARMLQLELGVPEGELCLLPKLFNLFRSESVDALTDRFEEIAAECRDKLAAKAEAKAAAEAIAKRESPAGLLEEFAKAAENKAARASCERTLANLQRRERMAGLPVTQSRSFKGLDLASLKAIEGEMLAKLHEIAPTPSKAKAAVIEIAIPSIKAEEKPVAEEKRYGFITAAEAYERGLEDLRRLNKSEASRLYHPDPRRLSEKNLRALIYRVIDATRAIEAAAEAQKAAEAAKVEQEKREAETKRIEAESKKAASESAKRLARQREEHARTQALRSEYDHARRTNRTSQPFGVWAQSQSERPMRRAG